MAVMYVGNSKGQVGRTWAKFRLTWRNIPGYLVGDWNHIAFCRERGSRPGWHLFINGRRGPVAVKKYITVDVDEVWVEVGAEWHIGSTLRAHFNEKGRYQKEMNFDEACLRVGEAIFTEEFTPLTSPYDFG